MKRLIASGVLIFLLCASAFATTVVRLSLDDMIEKAQSIVHGRVRGRNTQWSSNGKLILTTYTIDVEETIKGPVSKSVELTSIGGKLGDLTLYVAGMPSFDTGEEAVVFIEKSGGYSVVVGLSQGKFSVKNGEVANSVAGLAFPDGKEAGAPLKMRVEDFTRQIKSRLHQ
jgi:hypothetical protein